MIGNSANFDSVMEIGRAKVFFLDVVRGLKSEGERIRGAVSEISPDLIAMSVSKEEIEGLRTFAEDPFEIEMTRYEELYAQKISRFGDVYLPPPCFLAGLEEAEKTGVELMGIDMDDESHTTAYCALVSGRTLFRHTIRFNFLRLRSFQAETPAEFAIEWDRRVNNLRGFRELEREREKYMAEALCNTAASSGRNTILALIDVERAQNVRAMIDHGT